MRTMIVTGGAGFIGSNFVRRVLDRTDWNVVVFDDLTYAGNLANLATCEENGRYAFVKGDIANRNAVRQLLAERTPQAIINFAAESHVDRSIDDASDFIRTNIVGAFELLEATRHYLKEADDDGTTEDFRFIHVSTDEVYGSLGATGLFHETTAYAPNSPYAASKASADHLVRAYHETYGLPALITNCSNNYGPHQFPEKLIPLMILNALEGKALPIYGDGLNVRDWIYVDDHCDGVLAALERGLPGEKYNLGGRSERTNLEIVDGLCAALEEHAPVADNNTLQAAGVDAYIDLKTFVKDRPGHDRRYAIDDTKAREELGWAPSYDLAKGLNATVRWYLENRDWCEDVQSGNYRRERLGTDEGGAS